MRVSVTENRNLPIRSDHCRGMAQDPLEILFADSVEDPLATALLDDPKSYFSSVLDGRFHSAQASHISERLAGQRCIPFAARDDDILRIAAAALVANESGAFSFDLLARCWILQALQYLLAATFLRPGREQR